LDRELDLLSPKSAARTETTEIATDEKAEVDSNANLEKLQKRYSSLQKMAASMGLDTTSSSTHKRPHQAPEGRAGAGGRTKKPRATMVLDNRTTTLRIIKIPEDLRDQSALLSHFKTFGEVSNLTIEGSNKDGALVQFATRREAEQALARGKSVKNHTLIMGWHNPHPQKPAKEQTEESHKSLPSNENQPTEEEVVQEVYDGQEGEGFSDDEPGDTEEERSWKR